MSVDPIEYDIDAPYVRRSGLRTRAPSGETAERIYRDGQFVRVVRSVQAPPSPG